MNGINAKRIVAMAAGAVLLGSSVVAANVMYENVELVNENGQPTAKIVVGSGAQISDGVAAANIAAAIANMAYKSSTLSAKVMGEATCKAGGSASGAGTCEVSDKKVTLDIEIPGVLGNAYQFKTLITDTLDKTTGNRMNTLSEDNYTATNVSDVSTVLSPLRFVYSDTTTSKNLYRISGSQFAGFATQTVSDPQAGGQYSYQVEQNFWTGSSADGVIYDSGSAYRQVVAKPKIAIYNLRFLGNDYGVPYCTKADETTSTGNWAWCTNDSSSTYRTDNHRVRVPFMGSNDGWVISSMTAPSTGLASSTAAINGGIVKLAKEAKYDIINVGGELDAGTMKIRLADISVATGSNNAHPAILDVLDAAGAVIGQIQVNPGETYTFTQSGTSNQIKVHVYRTAPGFTLNAKWAEIALYTDEITLQDGQRYNLASSGDDNYNIKVSLIWKNKDYASSGTTSTVADSLREIVLYDEDTFIGKKYVMGDKYDFPVDNAAYRLTYNGLDLTDGDYIPVTITSLTNSDYPISTDGTDCTSSSNRVTYTARLIQFKTDGTNFGSGSGTDLLGTYKLDTFYYDPVGGVANSSSGATVTAGATNLTSVSAGNATGGIVNTLPAGYYWATASPTISSENLTGTITLSAASIGGTTYNLTTNSTNSTGWIEIAAGGLTFSTYGLNATGAGKFNGTQAYNTPNLYLDASRVGWSPAVLYKPSGYSCYLHTNVTATSTIATSGQSPASTSTVRFDPAGQDSGSYGLFYFSNATSTTVGPASLVNGTFFFQEDAGKNNTVSHTPVFLQFPFINSTDTWRFKGQDSSTSNTFYQGIRDSTFASYEPVLYTERGSKVTSVGTTDIGFKVAKLIGQPTFTFAPVSTDGTTSSTGREEVLKVGESVTLTNGVKVTVRAINELVGSCVVSATGGSPACTVVSSGLSAVLSPDNTATVTSIVPVPLASSLVVMDKDAAGTGVVIAVGGPVVNSVTSEALKGSNVDFKATSVVVKAIGTNTVVVAGQSAKDTMDAAEQFIAGISKK